MSKKDFFSYRIDDLRSNLNLSTSMLRHHGETGTNLEMAVESFLSEYLPNKIGIETGFVRTLENPEWQSPQIDILLTRKDIGHPLAVLPGCKVFPIESVIGFMEITQTITRKKLIEDFLKVKELKQKQKRTYILPLPYAIAHGIVEKPRKKLSEQELRTTKVYWTISDLQPRFYYFAFGSRWAKTETICENIAAVGKSTQVHLHGMFILNKGFFFHKPYGNYHVNYTDKMPDAFVLFINNIMESLQSFTDIPYIAAIPLDKYANVTTDLSEYSLQDKIIKKGKKKTA